MSITINNSSWSRDEIKNKLNAIGNLEGRKAAWVCTDLSTPSSTWIGRLFHWIIKHYKFLLSFFYNIDLEKSKDFLHKIRDQIKTDKELFPLHQKAVERFNELFPKHQLKYTPTVASLVAKYNSKWNESNKCYDIAVNVERVTAVLKKSIISERQQIEALGIALNTNDHYGFIMKMDLEPQSTLFVRADLHADLKSLLENLNTIQKEGLLDENFKCRPGVKLVFLGDYADRGNYDLQLLELLALLRRENPTQVILLKGNHEDAMMNQIYAGSQDFRAFLSGHFNLLTEFYDTLPLTVYMGEKREMGKRHYVHFTHGLFELKTDPSPLLDNPKPVAAMPILKNQEFSERIKQINLSVIQDDSTKEKRRAWKLGAAARRIQELANGEPERDLSTYNWGDVAKNRSTLGYALQRQWKLAPQDIKHYMRLSEGSQAKVKLIIRGHEHEHEHFRHYKVADQVLITTLTVGMDCHPQLQKQYHYQPDRAYILYTGPKVKEWTKMGLLRQPGSSNTLLTDPCPITSDDV